MPVVAITVEGRKPVEVASRLDEDAIFLWTGDFYAVGAIDRLGLADSGGLIRIGINHYNTADEIDRFLGRLDEIAR